MDLFQRQLVYQVELQSSTYWVLLLLMQLAAAVLETLKQANITLSMMPADCTSLVQVLDVSVNGIFKDFLKEAMDDELFHPARSQGEQILPLLDQHDEEESSIRGIISAVGLRRILLTQAVGKAWSRFGSEKYRTCIFKTFRR